MPPDYRQRIAAAFAGASRYDRHAAVQRRVAQALAQRIAAMPLPPAPRVLEIGCGTGFLTEALIAQGFGGEWLVTDLASEMVKRCMARIGEAQGRQFAVLDGEHGQQPAGAPFDLIVSSLTFQWFTDLPAAVARLTGWLAPGGTLAFTTLAGRTFGEWRAAHAAEGLVAGTPQFSDVSAIPGAAAVEPLVEHHPSARDFLRTLKAIGAGTPAAGHRPLSPSKMRRVMARFEAQGADVTYEVVTGLVRRDSSPS